jgi:NADH dehydrogenase
MRKRTLLAFERAETTEDEAERRRLLTFVVVGGGPTGVEMAGAIAELGRIALASDFRRIDPCMARVILIEAGPRLLPPFPEKLSAKASQALGKLGVEVMLGHAVTACDGEGVVVDGQRIGARTVIWAAGVMASPAAKWLGVESDRAGRVIVQPDLSLSAHPEIFAIGDTALVLGADDRPVPGIAPAAKQMGAYVGAQIEARINGDKAAARPFRYRHQGNLATIGRKAAVADFGRLQLSGFPAWLLWALAHVYFLIGWRNRAVVALNWFWTYLTQERGARLITGDIPPPGEAAAASPSTSEAA